MAENSPVWEALIFAVLFDHQQFQFADSKILSLQRSGPVSSHILDGGQSTFRAEPFA